MQKHASYNDISFNSANAKAHLIMQLTGCLKHSSLQFPADFDEA
jgi:hypothetical protein